VRLVGLTGGIATGKSTAARLFAERGAIVVDADVLARRAVAPGTACLEAIRQEFGARVLRPDGSLDREALGALAFSDEAARERLNAIVHPQVAVEAEKELEAACARDPRAIVIYDVPLLFEVGMEGRFDRVVVVYVPREIQLRRLQGRDGVTRAEAEARLSSQWDIEEKVRRADHVLDNRGSVERLRQQVGDLWACWMDEKIRDFPVDK
jgi:dephospho-CoA kinase